MTRRIVKRIDYLLDAMTLFVVIGGGVVFHALTSLAFKGYYGNPWGYLAFIFPGGSEIFFTVVQLLDGKYNYAIILGAYLCIASCKVLLWLGRRFLKRKLAGHFRLPAPQC
jgi:hypothetical protein